MPMIASKQFSDAILCLKQVKKKYCPREMLSHIENTFKLMDKAKDDTLGNLNETFILR